MTAKRLQQYNAIAWDKGNMQLVYDIVAPNKTKALAMLKAAIAAEKQGNHDADCNVAALIPVSIEHEKTANKGESQRCTFSYYARYN